MELGPYIRPLISLIIIISALRGLYRPESILQQRLSKRFKDPVELQQQLREQNLPPVLRKIRISSTCWLILGLIILWFSPVHFGIYRQPQPPTTNHWTSVEAKIQQFAQQHSIPGLLVALVHDGTNRIIPWGTRSLAGGPAIDDQTLFEIGSITKTFTGVLLAKMIENGRVRLDQPIAELLPPLTPLPQTKNVLTLRHLATHSAGFPAMPPNFGNPSTLFRVLVGLDPYHDYSDQKLLAALAETKLEYDPGTRSEYSNYTVSLLGWLLAQLSRETYEKVILREVCQPLGMHRTWVTLPEQAVPQFAQGYSETSRLGPIRLGRPSVPWNLANAFAGAGALRSCGADMLKYLRANMGLDTNALSSALARSHQTLLENRDGHHAAMTWWRRQSTESDPVLIWHNGGTGGFRSFMAFTEDKRQGIVILSTTNDSVDRLGIELLRLLRASRPNSNHR